MLISTLISVNLGWISKLQSKYYMITTQKHCVVSLCICGENIKALIIKNIKHFWDMDYV